jgi:ubiquinol-cytochrome c reductase cytochrome b subunit
MGLAIGYSVAMSFPLVGANLAMLIWGGPFPGVPPFWSRMYVAHVFLLPILIGTLLTLHLFLVAARHHTQFRSERASEHRVVGTPMFPGQAPRSCCSAALCRSIRSGSGGRTTLPKGRTARSPTGTSAG